VLLDRFSAILRLYIYTIWILWGQIETHIPKLSQRLRVNHAFPLQISPDRWCCEACVSSRKTRIRAEDSFIDRRFLHRKVEWHLQNAEYIQQMVGNTITGFPWFEPGEFTLVRSDPSRSCLLPIKYNFSCMHVSTMSPKWLRMFVILLINPRNFIIRTVTYL